MAEPKRPSFQKPRTALSSRKEKLQDVQPSKRPTTVPQANQPQLDLLVKEEEYKRLNAELEAKTTELVRQAEELMREQKEVLAKPISSHLSINLDTEEDKEDFGDLNPSSPTVKQAKVNKKPSVQNRPLSGKQTRKMPKMAKGCTADDVAILEDFVDYSLAKAINSIEDRLEEGAMAEDTADDVMPSVGEEMGSEAQIRFLKAKLRVMHEEVNRLSHECRAKDDEASHLTSRLKEAEEERRRLQKTVGIQQSQAEKHKALTEDSRRKCDGLQQQVASLKKEVEALKRAGKQAAATHGTTEVRLNRALEEAERCKTKLSEVKQGNKDSANQEQQKLEQLLAENRKLEKQKAELIAAFKKQLKLIDVLKRQKMHFEAAKMLSFTEEEFVKALDWGTS